jgi:hypothetical protein
MNASARRAAALLLVTLAPWGAACAASGIKPWQVKNLVADKPVCTGKGLYSYHASWTPISWENKPWPRYFVNAHNCSTGPVSCTATRCTVQATSCRVGAPGAWIGVTAGIGKSISGVREAVPPTSYCR